MQGMEDGPPESTPEPGESPALGDADLARRPTWRDRLQPRLRQAGLNLRTWLTLPLKPDVRACLVRYTAREHRTGLTWDVELPVQCWRCAAQSGLKRKRIKRDIRAFGSAVPWAAGGALLIALLLAAQCFLWMVFKYVWLGLANWAIVFLGIPFLVALVVRWRSWRETIRVSVFTCPEHADDLTPPDAVVDDEQLHLFLPTPELAEEAWAELRDARRRQSRAWNDEHGERP